MKRKHLKIDLKKRRKDLGMTQSDLAKKCGVTKATIQIWEQRKGNIRANHLKQYARCIKLNPMDIIDSEHEFGHYEDNGDYRLENVISVKQIENLAIRLEIDRVKTVYRSANAQLNEQNNIKVTFDALKKRAGKHDLEITGEIYDDNDVRLLDDIDFYPRKFHGTVPDSYLECVEVKTNKIKGAFSKDQIVFLRKATPEVMYSGVVVIAEQAGKYYVRIYRSTHDRMYLIPLHSDSADKEDEDLNYEDTQYIWHEEDDWQIPYLINQSSM